MKIEVKLFAMARQRVGAATAAVEVPENAKVAVLREALARQYPMLADAVEHLRFAVNNDYAGNDSIIPPTAEVACIPPVSGG